MLTGTKVLHVSESDAWSGGAAQLLALAQGLKNNGWPVWIACRPGSGLKQNAEARGLPTLAIALSEDYDLFSAWKLARFIASEGISVLHAHHNRSHAVCLLAKLLLKFSGRDPVLIVSRRVSFAPGRNPFSRWKYQSRLIDRIVAVADAVKRVLVESGVAASKIAVIHSGVDISRFSPRPPDRRLARELGLPEGKTVIGKIANASPWKGQPVLLEAAAKLLAKGRAVHFLFVGRDTDGAWLRAEARRLNIERHVSLAGFRADIPEILSCLAISVNAAVQGEGLSGALRESLCLGIPVVASDIAGNRELLRDYGPNFLYPPGDAAALAQRLEWTLDHGAQVKTAVAAWRKSFLAEFSLERTVADTEALYRELLVRPS